MRRASRRASPRAPSPCTVPRAGRRRSSGSPPACGRSDRRRGGRRRAAWRRRRRRLPRRWRRGLVRARVAARALRTRDAALVGARAVRRSRRAALVHGSASVGVCPPLSASAVVEPTGRVLRSRPQSVLGLDVAALVGGGPLTAQLDGATIVPAPVRTFSVLRAMIEPWISTLRRLDRQPAAERCAGGVVGDRHAAQGRAADVHCVREARRRGAPLNAIVESEIVASGGCRRAGMQAPPPVADPVGAVVVDQAVADVIVPPPGRMPPPRAACPSVTPHAVERRAPPVATTMFPPVRRVGRPPAIVRPEVVPAPATH